MIAAAQGWLRPQAPKPHLTTAERSVLCLLVRAAHWGQPAPTTDKLAEALGDSVSIRSLVKIVRRLEDKGLIAVRRFQRSRQVVVLKTGRATRAPDNQTPHWRAGK